MKLRNLILCASLVASQAWAETLSADEYYRRGEAALEAGNVEGARAAFTNALRINPQHGNARFKLLSLKEAVGPARVKLRQNNFAKIKLKQINFEGVSLQEAIQDLGVLVEQASNEEFIPNFVLEDPDGLISENKITLRLRNMPANAVLQYVLSQGKARVVWSEHAIAIKPIADGKKSQ